MTGERSDAEGTLAESSSLEDDDAQGRRGEGRGGWVQVVTSCVDWADMNGGRGHRGRRWPPAAGTLGI